MVDKVKAIGLVSDGLDSMIAVALVKANDIDVQAVHVLNGFSADYMKIEIEGRDPAELAAERRERLEGNLGVPCEVIDRSHEYLDVLLNPAHGYGANVNPCIDCRIFLLRQAKAAMERAGASFVFTGEVLGQRPMSQHRKALTIVEEESGLEGRLLRPLSARLLPPTYAEKDGLIDRDTLLDIQGRSRRRQLDFANEHGLSGFSQPAGGCVLTDENYAKRFLDYIKFHGKSGFSRDTAVLLAVGRHFRLSNETMVVVGRNEVENNYLERRWNGYTLLAPREVPGPTTLVFGKAEAGEARSAAMLTARYSDGKYDESVAVVVRARGGKEVMNVKPSTSEFVDSHRI